MLSLTKSVIIAQLESAEEFPISLSDVWEWLGYARKDSATRAFLALEMAETVDYCLSHRNEENSGGRPEEEIFLTIDAFKLWCMSARTAKGKEVRLYYLQVEKEWKALKLDTSVHGITADHIEAHTFKTAQYAPWALNNTVAAQVFVGWLVDDQKKVEATPPPKFALPSGEMQEALNGAFLNLNRSGLAMNKLFHWIDRMPTMDNLGREAMSELSTSLSVAESEISGMMSQIQDLRCEAQTLKAYKKKAKKEISDLKFALASSESQRKTLSRQVESLKARSEDKASPSVVVKARSSRRNGDNARSASPFLLPPAD